MFDKNSELYVINCHLQTTSNRLSLKLNYLHKRILSFFYYLFAGSGQQPAVVEAGRAGI